MILLDNDDVLILVDDNDVLIMLDDDDVLILLDNGGVKRCLLFSQPGFTMRSNLGRTVTQATLTGSRTNKIIPGSE